MDKDTFVTELYGYIDDWYKGHLAGQHGCVTVKC